jgi:hypothetical protein
VEETNFTHVWASSDSKQSLQHHRKTLGDTNQHGPEPVAARRNGPEKRTLQARETLLLMLDRVTEREFWLREISKSV